MAADYDAPGGANDPGVIEPMVEVLAELAGEGPVLELAVGTGRIAAPLAVRGLDVRASKSAGRWRHASPTSRVAIGSR